MNSSHSPLGFVRLHPSDNVLVAARTLDRGNELETPGTCTVEPIALGHKVAARQIAAGEPILKYGQIIGRAREPIAAGRWVHVHNVVLNDHTDEYEFATEQPRLPSVEPGLTFQGYRRSSGRFGTRNYLAVISSVNCSATVSKAIARHFTAERLRDYPNIDGVVAFTHPSGCAIKQDGIQHRILNRTLGGIARQPNIGGFLLVGLGCEKATIEHLIADQQLVQIEGCTNHESGPPALTIQTTGGTRKTIDAGIRAIESMLPQVANVQREPVPISELVLGTQCGGSDGSSGITANPAVGVACDLLVAHGGTAILGETTEMVGAEHLLTRRAASAQVGKKLLDKIAWWHWYAGVFGEQFDDNRSAGNAAGGLTTIAEKSLGAIAKGGSSRVNAVYEYAEPITQRGLVIMDTPGFDPCSLTGMVAGGANLIVFTTGRGSCYGCKPVPSLKIATNTPMFARLMDDMDVDAGPILNGVPVREIGELIFRRLVDVASGELTKSELLGVGDEEFVPWIVGPVL